MKRKYLSHVKLEQILKSLNVLNIKCLCEKYTSYIFLFLEVPFWLPVLRTRGEQISHWTTGADDLVPDIREKSILGWWHNFHDTPLRPANSGKDVRLCGRGSEVLFCSIQELALVLSCWCGQCSCLAKKCPERLYSCTLFLVWTWHGGVDFCPYYYTCFPFFPPPTSSQILSRIFGQLVG